MRSGTHTPSFCLTIEERSCRVPSAQDPGYCRIFCHRLTSSPVESIQSTTSPLLIPKEKHQRRLNRVLLLSSSGRMGYIAKESSPEKTLYNEDRLLGTANCKLSLQILVLLRQLGEYRLMIQDLKWHYVNGDVLLTGLFRALVSDIPYWKCYPSVTGNLT